MLAAGVYSVLNRRKAQILREELKEGTDTFVIAAFLPVHEAFGFVDELRHKGSGAASAQLMQASSQRLQVPGQ